MGSLPVGYALSVFLGLVAGGSLFTRKANGLFVFAGAFLAFLIALSLIEPRMLLGLLTSPAGWALYLLPIATYAGLGMGAQIQKRSA